MLLPESEPAELVESEPVVVLKNGLPPPGDAVLQELPKQPEEDPMETPLEGIGVVLDGPQEPPEPPEPPEHPVPIPLPPEDVEEPTTWAFITLFFTYSIKYVPPVVDPDFTGPYPLEYEVP